MSVIGNIRSALEPASEAERTRRLAICAACPFRFGRSVRFSICQACGCPLASKTALLVSDCPKRKW